MTSNAAQNWNQPSNVPKNKKTFATTAAPNQNTKSPTESAIRLIGERTHNRKAKMTTCNMPMPNIKLNTAPKKSRCCDGLAGASKLKEPESNGNGTKVKSPKKPPVFWGIPGVKPKTAPRIIRNPPMDTAVIKPSTQELPLLLPDKRIPSLNPTYQKIAI